MNLNNEKKQMNELPEWLQKLWQISPMLARQAETDYIDLKKQSEQLRVSFNVGDKVLFDNKKAVVLWTSVNYLDIEITGTNKILQGVHTSKVLPR